MQRIKQKIIVVLAIAYVVSWVYLLLTWYLPWQEKIALSNYQTELPENLVIGFVTFGLLALPVAFYFVWTNLLRALVKTKIKQLVVKTIADRKKTASIVVGNCRLAS